MMFWTLDTSSTNNENLDRDATLSWEREIDQEEIPKIKFPLKATSENIDSFDLHFSEPVILDPMPKKEQVKINNIHVLDISNKKKGKANKSKLF